MTATTPTTLKMKLLIDTNQSRVLFAEANKDVVDFLLSLLALPVATIVGMLGNQSVCGSVGNLYASVENLDWEYIVPGAEKGAILWPKVMPSAASSSRSPMLLLPAAPSCPRCKMNMGAPYVDGSGRYLQAAASSCSGFVQPAVTYTVKDDLTVTPMSNISSITLFGTLGATDFSALQERTVLLGYDEGLQILKASLQSKTVLTDVFLSKRAYPRPGWL